MAKVDTTVMKNWQDGQTIKAYDYKKERDTIVTAINATDDEIKNSNTEYLLVSQIMEVY